MLLLVALVAGGYSWGLVIENVFGLENGDTCSKNIKEGFSFNPHKEVVIAGRIFPLSAGQACNTASCWAYAARSLTY